MLPRKVRVAAFKLVYGEMSTKAATLFFEASIVAGPDPIERPTRMMSLILYPIFSVKKSTTKSAFSKIASAEVDSYLYTPYPGYSTEITEHLKVIDILSKKS
jgi:hypothetical protein